jgi:predicted DNA repair protein MutK
MASGLLMLLDDIATILDDIAILTKIAAKKTAGVLGDDLALNAQQVTGVDASRELPVVWAVAKGSLVNKAILVPVALALSAFTPAWVIVALLIVGGLYLCYEGCEKLAHKFLHPAKDKAHQAELKSAIIDPAVDMVAIEKEKVKGAIRTDFILSAEIIVITLGTVTDAPFMTQVFVLISIALLMTVGVYGLVAGIVKLDDLGMRLIASSDTTTNPTMKQRTGFAILAAAPYLMKFLSIAGTAAMFLVGGGILVHGIPPLHHAVESIVHPVKELESVGPVLGSVAEMSANAIVGLLSGAIVLIVLTLISKLRQGSTEK